MDKRIGEIFGQKSMYSFDSSSDSNIRIIVYAAIILFLVTRDPTIVYVGIIATCVLLITNSGYEPTMPSVRQDNIESVQQGVAKPDYPFSDKSQALHNFVPNPVNNQADFIKGLYPNMLGPTCKDDPSKCSPGKF